MGCICALAATTIKYLLFIFNLVFALGGLAIIALGTLIQLNLSSYDEFFGDDMAIPSIILIVAGCIVFIISFFGCCGAIRESVCMLFTYAVFLIVLFALLLTGAILSFNYIDTINKDLHQTMKDSMNTYVGEGTEAENAQERWNTMQKDLFCCGVDSYMDWLVPPGAGGPGLAVRPDSCACTDPEAGCVVAVDAYSDGCYDKVFDYITTMQYAMGGVAIGMALLEVTGIVCACCFASAIKSKRKS